MRYRVVNEQGEEVDIHAWLARSSTIYTLNTIAGQAYPNLRAVPVDAPDPERIRQAVKVLREEPEYCTRCGGGGSLWADGKPHLLFENLPTIPCEYCGGSGHIIPQDQLDRALDLLEDGKNEHET